MRFLTKLSLLLFFGISVLGASVGNITALSGAASIERGSAKLPAALGGSLESKDTVATAKNSKVQLTFKDNTIITVGKESRFSVEEYLFDATPDSKAKFNMIRGTIRAMSGKIGKIAPEKFTVKTKTATIGIRGTDFIVRVLPSGEIAILCMQGSIIVRSADGLSTVIVPAGSFVTLSAEGVMSDVKEFTQEELKKVLEEGLNLSASATSEKMLQSGAQILHADESLDRGAAVNVESLVTDTGMTKTTESVSQPSINGQVGATAW